MRPTEQEMLGDSTASEMKTQASLRAGLTSRMTQKQRPWLLLQVVQKGLRKPLMSLTENALGWEDQFQGFGVVLFRSRVQAGLEHGLLRLKFTLQSTSWVPPGLVMDTDLTSLSWSNYSTTPVRKFSG